MKKIRWIWDNFEDFFLVIALGTITVTMFAQVISRYVFAASIVWTEELSRYFFILLAATGLSLGVRKKTHLRIDVLETAIPFLKRPFEFIGDVFLVAICIFLLPTAVDAIIMIRASGQITPALEMPFYIVYIPYAVGMVLLVVRVVEKNIRYAMQIYTNIKNKNNAEEGV